MSLNKQKMVREIGRRTRLKNRDVQVVLETMIEVWIEELTVQGRIELENFFVLETYIFERASSRLRSKQQFYGLRMKVSKCLRKKIQVIK